MSRAKPNSEHLPGLPSGPRWFAVQCLFHREGAAQRHLENQGFRVFLPRFRKTRRHARKFETIYAPFFSGYLFIELDLARARWQIGRAHV